MEENRDERLKQRRYTKTVIKTCELKHLQSQKTPLP